MADTSNTLDNVEVAAPAPRPDRGPPAPPEFDELVILTVGKRLGGWQRVRLVAGAELYPRHFEIETTERYPGEIAQSVVTPRAPCQVFLRNDRYQDKILDVYIDRYVVEIDKGEHRTRLIGRGKGEDFLDSSVNAFETGWAIQATSLSQVAKLLVQDFDIDVQLPDGDVAIPEPLRVFAIHPGYQGFFILEEFCRAVGRLLYEDENGDLVIAKVSSERAGNALVEGQNVERCYAMQGADQRFATYIVLGQNRTETVYANVLAQQLDPQATILGKRLRIIPSETPDINLEFSLRRAVWEANRRFGRAFEARVTVTGWRDGKGQLWRPNTIVSCLMPNAKIKEDRAITEVAYLRGPEGTQTILTLMPPKALDVQPFTIAAAT